ncbi:amidase [Comamonas humi]
MWRLHTTSAMMPTATERLQQSLHALAQLGDEAPRIFTQLYPEAAQEAAQAADQRAARGWPLGPLDGKLVSVKDLFDVAGQATTAGSRIRQSAPPATADAPIVQRLRAAGAVIVGKTNMTEFAFSGIGINPHYGTPGNAADATRIPGGSSSGAGVSVGRGLVDIAIGSDTGGSVRIPAALNGVVGFKPTQARVPRDGAFPLSFTLDTVGPLARSVLDCAQADAVLSGSAWKPLPPRSVRGLRLGIPRGMLLDGCEQLVLHKLEQAVRTLSAQGAVLTELDWDHWMRAPFEVQAEGTISASEAAYIHREALATRQADFDPRVLSRIVRGQGISAPAYIAMLQRRAPLLAQFNAAMADIDALLLPTVPTTAPAIAPLLADDEAFFAANAQMLRNTSVFNFYDLPALSLPAPVQPGELPVGLMLVGHRQRDRSLLAVGVAVEQSLQQR